MTKPYDVDYFKALIKQDFVKRRKDSLYQNQLHDSYVDLIITQFYMNGELLLKTGFKAYLLEPLFNLEEYLEGHQCKNFDILLHNRILKQTLFIEVKSSFNSIAGLLSDFQKSVSTAKEKFDIVLAPILNLKYNDHDSIEYVLVLPQAQIPNVMERISSSNMEDIIIWSVSDIPQHTLKYEIFNNNTTELISKHKTHKNDELRSILSVGVVLSTIKTINALLNSDPCQKLEFYVPRINQCKFDVFNFEELKNRIFDCELFFKMYNNSEDAKKFIFSQLINNLKDMSLIKVVKETGDIYTNNYSLTIDKRLTDAKVIKLIQSTYLQTYLEKNEEKIEKEASDKNKLYHNQTDIANFS